MPYRDAGAGPSNAQTADSEDEYEYEYDENEIEVSQNPPGIRPTIRKFNTHFVTRHSMWILTYHP
jgi:hypothetical protein